MAEEYIIATESDAKTIGGSSGTIESNKCCTVAKAKELGCEIENESNYTAQNQLVMKKDLEVGYDTLMIFHNVNGLPRQLYSETVIEYDESYESGQTFVSAFNQHNISIDETPHKVNWSLSGYNTGIIMSETSGGANKSYISNSNYAYFRRTANNGSGTAILTVTSVKKPSLSKSVTFNVKAKQATLKGYLSKADITVTDNTQKHLYSSTKVYDIQGSIKISIPNKSISRIIIESLNFQSTAGRMEVGSSYSNFSSNSSECLMSNIRTQILFSDDDTSSTVNAYISGRAYNSEGDYYIISAVEILKVTVNLH